MPKRMFLSIRPLLVPCLLVGCLGVMSWSQRAYAQRLTYAQSGEPEDPGLGLLQEEPHDLIFFTEKAGGGWAMTQLLDFPGRKPPTAPTGALKFQVVGVEGKELACKWSDIRRIDLWEIRLEREAKARMAKGDFSGAYPFLSVLIRDYPNRPGLRQLRSDFLWNDTISRAKRGELAPTLAMLEELRRYAPEYKPSTVVRAIGATTDRLLKKLVDEGELDLAQQMLARLAKDYQNERLDSVKKWNLEFLKMAQAKQKEAMAARDAKDYRKARSLARESIYLKPDIPGGTELIREIDTIYPLVNVGVLQTATVLEPTRLDNWGARRAGRLMYRTLFEMKGAGPEGGEYDFIFGDVEMSADRMHFDMNLNTEKLTLSVGPHPSPFSCRQNG